VIDSIFEFDFK